MAVKLAGTRNRLLMILGLSSAVSVALFIGRVMATQEWTYWFLVWNLFLAWIPLGLAWWLVARLRHKPWLSAGNIILSLLWVGFLPNAFYIASDMVHLTNTGPISLLYDVVMFISFTFNGFILGYLSLYAVHNRLKKRFSNQAAFGMVAAVLLLCSFAIYLGRYLRWNSWDVLFNPAGLVFDVSEPFINPTSHPQVFTTTQMFFVLLASIYIVCYQLVALAREARD
jgi:uncharacterized membrane protein